MLLFVTVLFYSNKTLGLNYAGTLSQFDSKQHHPLRFAQRRHSGPQASNSGPLVFIHPCSLVLGMSHLVKCHIENCCSEP